MASVASVSLIPLPNSDLNTSTKSPLPQSFKAIAYDPPVTLPSPYHENTNFPLALSLTSPHPSISDLVVAVKNLTTTGTIRSLLTQHGAIYFSNLGLSTARILPVRISLRLDTT
jgi:hypothetical protein